MESWAYWNGKMVPADTARPRLFDLGLLMGAAVAEQLRTFRQRLFLLEKHLDRFEHSLRVTGIDTGLSRDDWRSIATDVVERNAREKPVDVELGVSLFVTAGESPYFAGFDQTPNSGPTIGAYAFPLRFSRWADAMRRGVRLVTPAIRQLPAECMDPSVKCRSRIHYYLADQQARVIDKDASALLLSLDGYITETSAANVFFVRDGRLVSPNPVRTLRGISREFVLDLARHLGIEHTERDVTLDFARSAEEAFLTSTPSCMLPVASINGSAYDQLKGPVFQALLDAWSKRVDVDIERQIDIRNLPI